jgi:hypothetical protein
MKCLVLALASIIPAAFAADTAASLQKKLVGSWKLITIEGPNPSGPIQGFIIYDNTGHFSKQIVHDNRPAFQEPVASQASDKEKAAAFSTYTAYYGTYTIEPENGIVVHHVEGSMVPGQDGQNNPRYFEVKGNRLTLWVANDGKGGRLALKDIKSHVIWEKCPQAR